MKVHRLSFIHLLTPSTGYPIASGSTDFIEIASQRCIFRCSSVWRDLLLLNFIVILGHLYSQNQSMNDDWLMRLKSDNSILTTGQWSCGEVLMISAVSVTLQKSRRGGYHLTITHRISPYRDTCPQYMTPPHLYRDPQSLFWACLWGMFKLVELGPHCIGPNDIHN